MAKKKQEPTRWLWDAVKESGKLFFKLMRMFLGMSPEGRAKVAIGFCAVSICFGLAVGEIRAIIAPLPAILIIGLWIPVMRDAYGRFYTWIKSNVAP